MTGRAHDGQDGGEAILWRWPANWWERWRAGFRYLNPTGRDTLIFSVGVLAIVAAASGAKALDLPPGWILGVTAIALISWLIFFYSICLAWFRVSRLALTEDHIRHSLGLSGNRDQLIPREAVRHVVVYEGDGTVVLVGRNGELMRARSVAEAVAFSQALGAPAVIWPARKPGTAVELLMVGHMLVWLLLTFTIPPLLGVLILAHLIFGPDAGQVHLYLITGLVLPSGIAGWPVALLFTAAVSRLFLPRATLKDFLAILTEPRRWYGHASYRSRGASRWRDRLIGICTAFCARIAGIGPIPELHPDLGGGATPEMAAEALKLAEGAA